MALARHGLGFRALRVVPKGISPQESGNAFDGYAATKGDAARCPAHHDKISGRRATCGEQSTL
ncbi:hypothetical protein SBA4_1790002 [Candidatus Sulfopaludibacter sp. SbA4]|nr:hypothetical protein SBA4_1790002 [Candidatus Sulfopaludibacter sp. SbA4]